MISTLDDICLPASLPPVSDSDGLLCVRNRLALGLGEPGLRRGTCDGSLAFALGGSVP